MRSVKKKASSTTNLVLTTNFFLAAPLVTELRLEGGDEVLVVWGLDGEAPLRDQHNFELVRIKKLADLSLYDVKSVCMESK